MNRRLSMSPIACVSAFALMAAGSTQAAERKVAYDIPAGPLGAALVTYTVQSRRPVLFSSAIAKDLFSPGLHGRYAPDDALRRLIGENPIEVRVGEHGVVTLKARSTAESLSGSNIPVRGSLAAGEPLELSEAETLAAPAVSEVVVTGTNLRGLIKSPSPVVTLDRRALDGSGFATVADALNALPQAFSGQSTPATFAVGSDRLGTNTSAATGINLRGLGATSTLVLIDGRRMAGSGLQGDFADVSSIPTAAVERVEVLLDGASAVYGSDAVGGVVNILLRHDFDGSETRARIGEATGGGGFERQIAQTFGRGWSGGHVLATYEFYARDGLASGDRPFTASADLRSLGGSDHRLFYSHPGNILVSDPSGAVLPAYAIPPGQNGVGLTAASFLPGQINLENQRAGTDVIPDQRRESVYVTASQALGSRVEVSGDLRFSRRTFAFDTAQPLAILTVTNKNPYYASPTGAPSELIGYSFQDELGPLRLIGSSEDLGASVSARISLPADWQANVYGAIADVTGRRLGLHRLNTRFAAEALGARPDDPLTPFSAARDGYFNPFGDGAANSQTVLDFIGSGFTQREEHSETKSLNAKFDGDLFHLPAGPVKAAVGGQVRWESFRDGTTSLGSGDVPVTAADGPYNRTVGAGFLELLVPLAGPEDGRPALTRVALSLAGRIEHYSDVGTTTNPKIGLIWEPSSDLSVRASYGTSFRAPTLTDVYSAQDVGPAFLPQNGVNTLVLLQEGGNLDLKPEHATSWTATLNYHPEALKGLKLQMGFFDTDFTDRIGEPVSDNIYNALGNPVYAPFIQYLDPNSGADTDKVKALLSTSPSASAGLFPASAYAAIVDVRYVNTGGLHVRGLDLDGSFGWALGSNHFDVGAKASYLIDYNVRVTPTSAAQSELNLPNEPIDFKGQASLTWTRGPYTAATTVRYTNAYADETGRSISSWTTVDLQARWQSPARSGLLNGVLLIANVQNLLDADPPFYDSALGVGYDPANADPLGRTFSLQVQKRW